MQCSSSRVAWWLLSLFLDCFCVCMCYGSFGLLVVGVNAQQSEGEWTGCVNQSGISNKVRIGEPTRICLQVANGINWAEGIQYVRAAFEPAADEYSRFYIPNSYQDLVASNGGSIFESSDVTVGAASQSSLSFLRLYYDQDNDRVYPYLTAILDVSGGTVTGISWDDACVFCGGLGDVCQENTYNYNGVKQDQDVSGQATKGCYYTTTECDLLLREDPLNTACDLTLYVVWTGTDVDGKALQSQAYRFSEFPAQELTDRLTQVIPTFGLNEDPDDSEQERRKLRQEEQKKQEQQEESHGYL